MQAAAGSVGGSFGFADIGSVPAWRNLRAPLTAIPADATLIRVVAVDDDLAPQHWIAVTPPRIPKLRTSNRWSVCRTRCRWTGWWAWPPLPAAIRALQRRHGGAALAHPAGPFRRGPNSPVMDNIGGGRLASVNCCSVQSPCRTHLRDDWFRDWGRCSG